MATLLSLPPELLQRVVDQLDEPDTKPTNSLTFALVARSTVDIARRRIVQDVDWPKSVVGSASMLVFFARDPAYHAHVRSLGVGYRKGRDDASKIGDFVLATPGLLRLKLNLQHADYTLLSSLFESSRLQLQLHELQIDSTGGAESDVAQSAQATFDCAHVIASSTSASLLSLRLFSPHPWLTPVQLAVTPFPSMPKLVRLTMDGWHRE